MNSLTNIEEDANLTMLNASFNFWFNNDEHIRSPFPEYIREQLREEATTKFNSWVNNISDKAEKEVNDEILVEKLEEIIFELALNLVKSDDEKITVQYPFLPRIDDLINIKDIANPEGESKVINREIIKKEDMAYLKVTLLNTNSQESWETEFELPE